MEEEYDMIQKLLLQKESKIVFDDNFGLTNCRFSSFSQRRFVGFRRHFEFDRKRFLVANKVKVQILAIRPHDLNSKKEEQSNGSNAENRNTYFMGQGSLLCCNNCDTEPYASSAMNPNDGPYDRKHR